MKKYLFLLLLPLLVGFDYQVGDCATGTTPGRCETTDVYLAANANEVADAITENEEDISILAQFAAERQYVFSYRNNQDNPVTTPPVNFTINSFALQSLDGDAFSGTVRINGVDITASPGQPVSVPGDGTLSVRHTATANNTGTAGQTISVGVTGGGNNNDAVLTVSIVPTDL